MTQTCASCGKQFQNSVSLDRHGTSCSRKRRRPPVANSQAHQRSRIDPPDNGDDGPSEEPPTIRSARSGRAVRILRRLLDYVPHGTCRWPTYHPVPQPLPSATIAPSRQQSMSHLPQINDLTHSKWKPTSWVRLDVTLMHRHGYRRTNRD